MSVPVWGTRNGLTEKIHQGQDSNCLHPFADPLNDLSGAWEVVSPELNENSIASNGAYISSSLVRKSNLRLAS